MRQGPRWHLVGLASILFVAVSTGLSLTGCITTTSCLCPKDCVGESKGGAQLWAANCSRCHNARSPSTYSDAQWDVVMHHMRVRAKLTPVEQQKIAEFLKAGN